MKYTGFKLADTDKGCYDIRMKKLRLTALATAVALLASCSVFKQDQTKPVPAATKSNKKPKKKTTPAKETIQQTTSTALLEGEASTLTEESYTGTTGYATTSAIPGRSGLRMGRFAPPEEATSTGSNEPPLPNAAEQRGLRSPQLPGTLPLDVNGQTKKN